MVFPVEQVSGRSAVMHLKSFNPLNPWSGMSPLQAAGLAVDIHNDGQKWNKRLIENGGSLLVIGGNPLAMRRERALIDGDELRPRAFALAFSGMERHPHVAKVRTQDGDVDLARDLLRKATRSLPPGRLVTSPVRSYEEHVGRALLAEGFRETATSMLFTKELAIRVEERALAPAVVR